MSTSAPGLVSKVGAAVGSAPTENGSGDVVAERRCQRAFWSSATDGDLGARAAPPRDGELQLAVIHLLRAADEPLGVSEVRLAVERCLRKGVSASFVSACLSFCARRRGRFERVGPGLYRRGCES